MLFKKYFVHSSALLSNGLLANTASHTLNAVRCLDLLAEKTHMNRWGPAS